MKTRESVDYLLLGALMSGPKHGYEILQFIERHFGLAWYVGTSQLYTVLRRLERNGLVTSQVESQENRPAKRVFAVSPDGRSRFQNWLGAPVVRVRDMRIEFIAKLFFAAYLGKEQLQRLLASQREILEQSAARIHRKLAEEQDPFRRIVLSSKASAANHWLDWLDRTCTPYVESTMEV